MSDGSDSAATPPVSALQVASSAAIRDELEGMFRRNLVGPRDARLPQMAGQSTFQLQKVMKGVTFCN